MNVGWKRESGASNVVEERWEQLLCTNRAAQWPVTAMQLTAPLCCREATGNIRSLPYVQTTLVFIWKDTSQPVRGSLQHSWTVWAGWSRNSRPLPLTHRVLITSGSPVCAHRKVSLVKISLLNQTVFFTLTVAERQRPAWCGIKAELTLKCLHFHRGFVLQLISLSGLYFEK